MASIQVNFYSDQLRRNVPFNALIPNDLLQSSVQHNPYYERGMKALYLLPGYAGSHQDWILNSRLQMLSNKYNLAILCPDGENSFYIDREATGCAYGQYIGKELVAYTRGLFGLSHKREDTFIGGYSMGGFGALRNGLKYHETFSKIIALSSALIIHDLDGMEPEMYDGIANYAYYTSVFGDLKDVIESDKNPEFIIKKLKQKENGYIPQIYMACGENDFLIQPNRQFAAFLKEQAVEVTYEEGPGVHNWAFWQEYIEHGVKWLMAEEEAN